MKTEITLPNKELVLTNAVEREKIESIFNFHKRETHVFTIGDGAYFLPKFNDEFNTACGFIARRHAKENNGELFAITREDLKLEIKIPQPKKNTKNELSEN